MRQINGLSAGGRRVGRVAPSPVALTAVVSMSLAGVCGEAFAGDFDLGGGIEGRWGLDLSVGAAVRTEAPSKNFISIGNGGRADGATIDDGNLNYGQWDVYSLLGKAIGEVKLQRDNIGVFGRGKAWYDYVGENINVPHGHSANGYSNNDRLDDSDFQRKSKFHGVELLDAYAFGNWDLNDEGNWLSVKAGNHVVNWGESLFTPGISSYNAVDASAARRPGAQVKEILNPVPQVSAALGVTDELSVESFYQFAWTPTTIEGCGTLRGPSDVLNCSDTGAVFAPSGFSDQDAEMGMAALGGLNSYMSNAGTQRPGDQGQFGVAARYYSSELGTEFGVYHAQYHQRAPSFSLKREATTIANSLYALRPSQYFEDYSAENIRIFGASASTNLFGWSVFGEYSFHKGVPVQINTTDLVSGMVNGVGPMAHLNSLPLGSIVHGYDRKDKHQLQIATIKSFPNVLGAESAGVLGELVYQHWAGIGNPYTSTRYGRSPGFGMAESSSNACGTSMGDYCEAEGYATSDALGLRLNLSLKYENVFAGVNLTPSIFYSRDIHGISPDGSFQEGRQNIALKLRADMDKTYYAEMTYSNYSNDAKYDTESDRDFVSLVVGMTF